MSLTPQPVRCSRCAGSGDIPLIAEDAFVYPDRKPLLECCPDCGGTGVLRDPLPAPEPDVEPTVRAKGRRR